MRIDGNSVATVDGGTAQSARSWLAYGFPLPHPFLVCRLAEGDYGAVVRELKKVLAKDANITCATAAAEVAGALGSGLRSGFSSAAKVCKGGASGAGMGDPGWHRALNMGVWHSCLLYSTAPGLARPPARPLCLLTPT